MRLESKNSGGAALMRKLKFAVCLALLIASALATAASAQPPREVSLSIGSDGLLTVKVDHSVNDPQKHFINRIMVYVNDKIAAQREYSSQSSAASHEDTFQLGAQPTGATIKVEAYCVIMGSASASIKVP
jgi:desulfoferrodoxin (superoxide reductase-like protein)